MSVTLDKKPKIKSKAQAQVEKECGAYTYSDLLSLRVPVSEPVPRPKGSELRGGLPLWNKKPLNTKLPLLKGPHGPIVFSRGKLGDKLWKNSNSSEFQLSDPYGYTVKFDYEPAHDRHLRAWLHRPHTLDTLQAQGLITPRHRVTCSVQQYNMYRQFLYNMHSDALRADAYRRENTTMERLMLKNAQNNAEKEATKLMKFEDSSTKRKSNFNKLEIMKMEKLENCRKRLQRVLDRAAMAEERKESDLVLRKHRMDAFDEKIRSRITNANNLERKNKIKAMKAWHKMDVMKKREFERRKQQREQEAKQKAEVRWKKKVEEQKKQIAKEEYLMQQKKNTKDMFQQQYMKSMKKEWSRMEDELNKRKCQCTLYKVKVGKREKSIKQIMQSVSEAYSIRRSLAILTEDETALDKLMDHVQQTLKEIRYDLEPYIVIAHAKGRLERQENVPLPVSGAIKFLLEQIVVEYTAINLSITMSTIANRVLASIDELRAQTAPVENRSMSLKRSSLLAVPRIMSISSGKTARISQVEEIPVYKSKDELTVSVDNLRRTKDRVPTPMPSISTLTDILFKEPADEEFEEDVIGEFPFIEQMKLKATITDVSNRILRMIPARVKSVVASRSYDRISNISSDTVDNLPENKPVAKLCSLLLFEDSIRDYVLTQIVDRIILGFMQDIHLTPSFLRVKLRQKLESKMTDV